MAVNTSTSSPSTVLLRRPLPPKITVSQNTQQYQKSKSKVCDIKRERLRKTEYLALQSNQNKGLKGAIQPIAVDRASPICNFDTALVPCKHRGPDPLPARQPRRLKVNPYELPVDGRFLAPLPEFTLECFVQGCDAPGRLENKFAPRQFIGRSDDTWFLKRINELNKQEELYTHVINGV